uniref:Putative hydrolase subunit n=1 Tax=mine drainage metagenome TaxID=410659 RepID=E6PED9_9ZZZZ
MRARIEPYGEAALLLELDEGTEMARQVRLEALASSIRREPEVREAVVGFGNLSVLVQRGSRRQIAACLLERLEEAGARGGAERLHEIPVRYDGEDLAELASLHGLSIEAAIALHLAPLYSVAFLGFSPGFAYLLGLDPRLATPRRVRPRALVPAGSVAIGDAFTAVYPVASPGGWHLLGRTSSTLFDPERRPSALLAAGDRLRFVRVR